MQMAMTAYSSTGKTSWGNFMHGLGQSTRSSGSFSGLYLFLCQRTMIHPCMTRRYFGRHPISRIGTNESPRNTLRGIKTQNGASLRQVSRSGPPLNQVASHNGIQMKIPSRCEDTHFVQFSEIHRHEDRGLVGVPVVAGESATLCKAHDTVEPPGGSARRPHAQPQKFNTDP